MSKQARDAARRMIARLKADPTAAQFVVNVPGGWRVVPEELWFEAFGQWLRLSDCCISGGGLYLYPGLIMRWRLRRAVARWRMQDGVHTPPECPHDKQTAVVWTQDGYTSWCKRCHRTVYHGD